MSEENKVKMACLGYEARLEDSLGAKVNAAERAELDAHLTSCGDCREAMEAAREASALLRVMQEPAAEPGYAFWTRLGAELRSVEREQGYWRRLERLAWRLSFGAAVVVMALAVYLFGSAVPMGRQAQAQTEQREMFPAPLPQQQDAAELLLTAGGNGNGR